ncbi:hypothetical protein ACTWP4_04770 [Gracilibacillus sp. D59]|uniref:hypothetical protein n=1 Tax=Gracilibacillus sp. D59 TaxID=3457434 RepID=UPI003FCDD350
MVFVCKQHVRKALKVIFLPHIQSISDDYKLLEELECEVCGKQADYKLYNFYHKEKKLSKTMEVF